MRRWIDEREVGAVPGSVVRGTVPAVRSVARIGRSRGRIEAGRLVEARAWGPGAVLVFAASATDPDGCETETRVIFDGP